MEVVLSESTRFAGKAVIVTGAARGIGEGIAERFACEGAKVLLVDIDKQVTETAARLNQAVLLKDVTARDAGQVIAEAAMGAFGRIDVLVNNAGILLPGTAESHTEEEWQQIFDVNVRAVWRLSRAVLPHMRAQGGGSIINMASVLGLVAARNRLAYASSKGALVMLTRCMAVDHAPDKIRVNCICPGFVETPLTDAMLAHLPNPMAERERRAQLHPLGLGRPEDVAGLAVYLASDESSWITGAAFPVDGGFSAV
jgi:meso-butanediol dehydrogenase / (S,S)-butanediol dehydrogenase / diacetyl reductase